MGRKKGFKAPEVPSLREAKKHVSNLVKAVHGSAEYVKGRVFRVVKKGKDFVTLMPEVWDGIKERWVDASLPKFVGYEKIVVSLEQFKRDFKEFTEKMDRRK